jgi:hypothetical protein
MYIYIMPKKSNKRSNKGKVKGTRKQKPILMIGCSKKNKKSCKSKFFSTLGNKGCLKCGPNCHCGPNCNCSHPCPGNCYLNRRSKKQKGGTGSGCGSCGCPIGGLTTTDMNKFVGGNKHVPVLIDPPSTKVEYIPTPGIGQNGGQCGQCGQIPVTQNGGELPHFNFFKPAAPIPGPFVGSAWGASVKEWPGVNGIGGDRNYLKSYADVVTNDPQQQMIEDTGYKTLNSIVGGGYNRKKSKRRRPKRVSFKLKRGGGLVPQDLVNLGRDFNYNFKSAYNTINGYKAPVDPLPYKDHLTGALTKTSFML